MGVGGIGWIGRLENSNRVAVRRGQGAGAEMLRALAKELALQLRKKLVWGNVGFSGEVRLGKGRRIKDWWRTTVVSCRFSSNMRYHRG